jgi:peptide/nickel transport system ATP-binding protein
MVPNLIRMPPGCLFEPRCPRAMDRCRAEKPPVFELDHDHGTRCWLAEEDGTVDNLPD